ncbi:hypothetical protein Cgig2_003207 [Carnegiea gigantea]|uniref:Serine-threonine/tyrosine-protein kinase catalytic domain-containing protein n=1 Tax=Carnegiea gigantea TaxID=171969 RepID=A0A9Q1K4U1_9CARY|nr:hypothetical protein Cgig2_003207 [Carnegiea gigantea]
MGGEFPTVLYNCANLQSLDLSHNLFAGKLPDDINKLSPNNLQHLNLNTNYFSGEIPQGLWTLPRISTLICSNNYLTGQLPGQVASRMSQLKINNNKLSGKIPPTVIRATWSHSRWSGGYPSKCILQLIYDLGTPKKKAYSVRRPDIISTDHILEARLYKRGILNNLADTNPIRIRGSGKGGGGSKDDIKHEKVSNEKQFQAEAEILSKIKHINIVKLLCCISSNDSKLLVYEYMENWSLDTWIHKGKQQPISSSTGHRLVRSSEYQRMIKVSLLSDVYSFGVVLLELVTGKGPHDRDDEYSNLVDWARKNYTQEHPIVDVLDVEVKKDCYL